MPTTLVIELCEAEIKVLQLTRTKKDGLRMDHAFAVPVGETANDEEGVVTRGALLREKLKELKIQPKNVGLIIPKQQAIVRLANLPSADLDEIDQMAQFKAEEYIPFNPERHIISHMLLNRDEMHGSDVLICAVDGPMMARSLMLCREAKVDPIVTDVSSVTLTNCLRHHEPSVLEEDSTLLLNVGRTHTELSVLKKGMLVATRSHTLGIDRLNRDMQRASISEPVDIEPQDIATQSIRQWIDKIVRFMHQSYDFATREHGVTDTARLYISGEGSNLSGLSRALELSLKVEITPFNPIEKLSRSPTGHFQADSLAGMNILLGLGLGILDRKENETSRDSYINLLPDEVIEEQEASAKRVLLMVSGTMLLITMLMLYLVYMRQATFDEQVATQLRKYNRELRPLVESMEEKEERIAIIEGIAADQTPALIILDQISAFPAIGSEKDGGRLTLSEFKYSTGDEVTISGTAKQPKDIGDFRKYLATMSYDGKRIFSEIPPPSQSPDELSRRGTVWAFTINAKLYSPEDEEDDS